MFCSTASPGESGVYKGQHLFLLKTAPTQLVRRYDLPKLCYVRGQKTACKCCLLLTDCCAVSCWEPSSDFWRVDATLWGCSLSASPAKCYFRGSPAGPVSEGSADICASARRPAVCFSSAGKPKPVGFVFLRLLAECLLLKPRC